MQAAATGILQVAQVELQHLSFQLTELDARFLHKSLVDLLYLLCGENGLERKKSAEKQFPVQFLILLSPKEPKISSRPKKTQE